MDSKEFGFKDPPTTYPLPQNENGLKVRSYLPSQIRKNNGEKKKMGAKKKKKKKSSDSTRITSPHLWQLTSPPRTLSPKINLQKNKYRGNTFTRSLDSGFFRGNQDLNYNGKKRNHNLRPINQNQIFLRRFNFRNGRKRKKKKYGQPQSLPTLKRGTKGRGKGGFYQSFPIKNRQKLKDNNPKENISFPNSPKREKRERARLLGNYSKSRSDLDFLSFRRTNGNSQFSQDDQSSTFNFSLDEVEDELTNQEFDYPTQLGYEYNPPSLETNTIENSDQIELDLHVDDNKYSNHTEYPTFFDKKKKNRYPPQPSPTVFMLDQQEIDLGTQVNLDNLNIDNVMTPSEIKEINEKYEMSLNRKDQLQANLDELEYREKRHDKFMTQKKIDVLQRRKDRDRFAFVAEKKVREEREKSFYTQQQKKKKKKNSQNFENDQIDDIMNIGYQYGSGNTSLEGYQSKEEREQIAFEKQQVAHLKVEMLLECQKTQQNRFLSFKKRGKEPPKLWKFSSFDVIRTIGLGNTTEVKMVYHRKNEEYYALKIIPKFSTLQTREIQHVMNEKAILNLIKHPFIVELFQTFQDDVNLYMILEYVPGGELFSHLRNSKKFTKELARFAVAEVILAVEYLHTRNIVYRDIKPENILIGRDGHIKMCDFGFAKIVKDRTWTPCGTPEYMAPEIIQGKGHGKASDCWALGILLYELLAGYPPFCSYDHKDRTQNVRSTYKKILEGSLQFPGFFDLSATDLITRLLNRDQMKRLGNQKGGIGDIKRHIWFKGINWDDVYHKRTPPIALISLRGRGDGRYFPTIESVGKRYGFITDDEQRFFRDF